MIHYVVAVYVGRRHNKGVNELLKDPTYMVKEQIRSLVEFNLPMIKKVTFVISPSDSNERDSIVLNFIEDHREILSAYELDVFIAPNNDNHSYGSWNFVMNKCIAGEDNMDFFLIEDDYFPAKDEFYIPFIERMKGNVAYVCQFYDRGAAISNGLMSLRAAKAHHKNFGNCINVESLKMMQRRGNYTMVNKDAGVYSQMHFLDKFEELKFSMDDVAKKYCQPFFDRRSNILLFGNVNEEVLIRPILYDDSMRHTYAVSHRAYKEKK